MKIFLKSVDCTVPSFLLAFFVDFFYSSCQEEFQISNNQLLWNNHCNHGPQPLSYY